MCWSTSSYRFKVTINHYDAVWPMTSFPVSLRFERAPVTFSGALRDDATGAHSFLFLRSRGTPHSHWPCHMRWQFETHPGWAQVTALCQTYLQTCTKSPVDLDVVGGLNPHMMFTAASNGLLLTSSCPRIWGVFLNILNMTWQVIWKA